MVLQNNYVLSQRDSVTLDKNCPESLRSMLTFDSKFVAVNYKQISLNLLIYVSSFRCDYSKIAFCISYTLLFSDQVYLNLHLITIQFLTFSAWYDFTNYEWTRDQPDWECRRIVSLHSVLLLNPTASSGRGFLLHLV